MDRYLNELIYLYEDIINNGSYIDIDDMITSFKIYLSRSNLNEDYMNDIILNFFNNNYMEIDLETIQNITIPHTVFTQPMNILREMSNVLNNYNHYEESLEEKEDDIIIEEIDDEQNEIINNFNALPQYYNNDELFEDLTELTEDLTDEELPDLDEDVNPINTHNINLNNHLQSISELENQFINIFNDEIQNFYTNNHRFVGAGVLDEGRAGRRNGFNVNNISDVFNLSFTYTYEPELNEEYKMDDVIPVLNEEDLKEIKKYNNQNEELNCCICIDNIKIDEEVSELKCGHKFHTECIEKLLKEYTNKCPVCRYECKSSKYINI